MEKKNKKVYLAPSVQVVEVKEEGVICASPGPYSPWEGENI